ncbi:MAG: 4-hydroxy-tetrahydrodipicolinate reductase [Candidatus Dormibacteraceae bacterium]
MGTLAGGEQRPIAVALSGHRGRVGRELAPALARESDIRYLGGIGRDDDLTRRLEEWRPQVLVDFTRPDAALANGLAAVAAGAVPVIGTSGMSDGDLAELEAACVSAGVGGIVAPNFALGAVLMMWLAELAAPYFEAAEVIEMHGDQKLDAPSGTALASARRLAAKGRFSYNRPRHSPLPGSRGAEFQGVGLHSVRLPGLLADQEVLFGLAGQTLTITHRTTSREAYAPGVLLAIRRLVAEPAFHRSMDSLLGLA